jgi:hypothetical protein
MSVMCCSTFVSIRSCPAPRFAVSVIDHMAIEFGHRCRNGHVVLVVAGFGRPLHAGSGVPRRRGPWSRSPERPESPALHGYHSVRSRMSS